MEEYGLMSGNKLNISKTQVLSLNYKPNNETRRRYNLNWNTKSIKYLGVIITKEFNKIYEKNYNLINNLIKYKEMWQRGQH